MDIRRLEDDLFSRWKRRYPSFVIDGAPCPEKFRKAKFRTVFVLKDINAPNHKGDFDLRKQLAAAPHPWWLTMARWCEAITRYEDEVPWSELKSKADGLSLRDRLAPFAFVQIKKIPGGGAVESNELKEYAHRDAAEIREQLDIYQPDIIIGAGADVGEIISKDIFCHSQVERTCRGVPYATTKLGSCNKTVIIHYMHPSARASNNVVCFGLLDAYREIVRKYFHDQINEGNIISTDS